MVTIPPMRLSYAVVIVGLVLGFSVSSPVQGYDDWEVKRPRPKRKVRKVVYTQDQLNGNFMALARYGDYRQAKTWLKRGADINLKNKQEQPLLVEFAVNGNEKGVAFLLENGADVNARDKDGADALIALTQEKSPKLSIAKRLIKAGIDVTASDNYKMTALAYAARAGQVEISTELINAPGIDLRGVEAPRSPNSQLPPFRNSPLWFAAANGHARVVELLATKDNTLLDDVLGMKQETALIAAARNCHATTVDTILSLRKDAFQPNRLINRRDEERMTAVMHAAQECCLKDGNTLDILLLHSPNLKLRAKDYVFVHHYYGLRKVRRDVLWFASNGECVDNRIFLEKLTQN